MLKLVENVVERVSSEETKVQEVQVPQSSIDEELKKIVEQIKARIHVVGVGGAGCNTVNRMMEVGVTSQDYSCQHRCSRPAQG